MGKYRSEKTLTLYAVLILEKETIKPRRKQRIHKICIHEIYNVIFHQKTFL